VSTGAARNTSAELSGTKRKPPSSGPVLGHTHTHTKPITWYRGCAWSGLSHTAWGGHRWVWGRGGLIIGGDRRVPGENPAAVPRRATRVSTEANRTQPGRSPSSGVVLQAARRFATTLRTHVHTAQLTLVTCCHGNVDILLYTLKKAAHLSRIVTTPNYTTLS
jgi:hypothetical protein